MIARQARSPDEQRRLVRVRTRWLVSAMWGRLDTAILLVVASLGASCDDEICIGPDCGPGPPPAAGEPLG